MQISKLRKASEKILLTLVLTALMLFFIQMPGSYVEARTDAVVKTVPVTLHANGGTYKEGGYGVVDSNTCIVNFDIYSDGDFSFVNVDMRPEWQGKKLLGWSQDKNAQSQTWSEWFEQYDEETYRYKFALPLDGSVTDLYAVWTNVYSITLNANGGNFGTNTDRFGNTTYIETCVVTVNKSGDGVGYSQVPEVRTDKTGMKHIGWSTDKNAKFPEYFSIGGLNLDRKPPETLYAVFGDPEAGEVTIIPKQTAYDIDLQGNKTGTIDYTIQWSGVAKPNGYSWDVIFQEGSSKIVKYSDRFDGIYEFSGNAYVGEGQIKYEALTTGTVKLKMTAGMYGKETEQTITINVIDSSKQEAVPGTAEKTVIKGKTYTVKKLKYKVTNADMKGKGTVTIIGTTTKKNVLKKLTVPAAVKINGASFKVTAIGNNAFKKFTKLGTVTIGNNVKTIGTGAFAGDTALTKVTVGNRAAKICGSAFYGSKKLKTIIIKSVKLKTVGKNAIKGIYKKAVIKVPKKQLKKYKKLFSSKTGFLMSMTIKG